MATSSASSDRAWPIRLAMRARRSMRKALASDGDRVQPFLQELRRYDRLVVVRLADRRPQGLDDRVVVGLVEVDQRDQVLARRFGLRRQHAVPVGLPPAAAPAGEQVTGVDRQSAGLIGRVLPAVLWGPHLQTAP